ncbi:hypothetical protein C8J56DRAFT_958399 [Mycena floridula]|nr:hypothetical protein C8J56DRAFT_958399 [Mycena floridula]
MKLTIFFSLVLYVSSRVAAYSELDSGNYELLGRYLHDESGLEGRYIPEFDIRDEWDHEFAARSDEFEARGENELTLRDEQLEGQLDLVPRVVQVVLMVAKQIVKEVIKTAIKAIASLIKDIKDEKKVCLSCIPRSRLPVTRQQNREIFVKNLLVGLVAKDSSFNYMIIHTKHVRRNIYSRLVSERAQASCFFGHVIVGSAVLIHTVSCT